MPEFLPTPQLPQGLAAELIRQRASRPNPWAALAQSVGHVGEEYFAGKQDRAAHPMLSPEEQVRMGVTTQTRAPGPALPGQAPPMQSEPMFNRPMPMSLAENILQRRTQESVAKEATTRMMGVQGAKSAEKEKEDMVPLTDETRATLKKRGIVLPKEVESVHRSLLGTGNSANVGIRDQQFWEKQWVDTAKDMDITKASSRTPLGVATTNNQKANRAMKLLNSKGTFTPQDMSLITTDLTAMMKGGSPDEELLRQQQYPSFYQSGVNLLQRITAKPQELNSPEVKAHLREVIQGIVEVDNRVIRDHVDNIESGRSDVIAKRPKDWEKLKGKALKNVVEDQGVPAGSHPADELIDKYLGGK